MLEAVAQNPGLLKLALALHGVTPETPGTTGFVEILLQGDVWARARLSADSVLHLRSGNGAMVLAEGPHEINVRLVPTPAFASRRNGRGIPLGDIVRVLGGYAMVTLGGGCGLSIPGTVCAFCRGRELTEKAGEIWPVDEVVEALRCAFDEGAAEFVHFCLGYFPGQDAGLAVLLPYLEAVHRHFDTMVAVTMHPPAALKMIERTYAAGVDALSYNLEAADEAGLRQHLPGRARFIGRKHYLAALAHAAKIFPHGAVLSEISIDLSSDQAVRNALRELTGLGVLPVLSISASGPLRPLTVETLAPFYAELFHAVVDAGLNMTWARDLSTSITPLEARYFVADAPQLPVLLHMLARNRLGAMATRSLARLRRRLRVKRVRASLDSSRL